MIKRQYFLMVKKFYGDGSGSYSWWDCQFSRTSWLPQTEDVYKCAVAKAKDVLRDKPGDEYHVCAFNRI